jgi:hypothetical protein
MLFFELKGSQPDATVLRIQKYGLFRDEMRRRADIFLLCAGPDTLKSTYFRTLIPEGREKADLIHKT